MALARSASGPGGLSINTGAANIFGSSAKDPPPAGGGLFGGSGTAQTSQPAQTSSLFGSATSQPAQQTGSLFGSSTTAASQPQQSGGLFGAAASTAQPTSSLFGGTSTATQPQQTGQTGGLFGSTATSQPQQSGGMFGSTAQTQQPAQTGGLFGSSTQQQQQQPAQTGGLFGSSIQQQQPQQQQPQQSTGGGMFGSSLGGGAGLFGAQSQQQPQQQQQQPLGNSLFGGRGLFAASTGQPGVQAQPGLTMGQSTNQQQQQVIPGVRIDLGNLKGTTRFNDLQEDLQKEIIKYDNMIQKIMEDKNQVEAFMPAHGEGLEAIPGDVKFVARKYDGAASALASDAQGVKALRELVKVDADNARLSFKAVDNLRLPPQYHTSGLWSTRQQEGNGQDDDEGSSDLINFFSKTGDEIGDQLKKLERNLGEIEIHMHGVQSNLLEQFQKVASSKNGLQGSGADDKVAELATVLREFEEGILQVAGLVGSVREGMTDLQLGAFLGNGRSGGANGR